MVIWNVDNGLIHTSYRFQVMAVVRKPQMVMELDYLSLEIWFQWIS